MISETLISTNECTQMQHVLAKFTFKLIIFCRKIQELSPDKGGKPTHLRINGAPRSEMPTIIYFIRTSKNLPVGTAWIPSATPWKPITFS